LEAVAVLRLLAAAVLLGVPLVGGYAQQDAPSLDPRVELAWGTTGLVEGDQWQAYLRLHEGTNVTSVGYQACIVPGACIIQPSPARRVDDRTWGMDTADYVSPLNGKPYPWPAGKVGVKWFLAEDGADFTAGDELPRGLDLASAECDADPAACLETHYLTLDVAPRPQRNAPQAGLGGLLLALVVAGWLRRG
jgi:hypothetical protein